MKGIGAALLLFWGAAVAQPVGGFIHQRELPLEGLRPNRDTLSSAAVFDLDAGPVTIAMPDAGARFMSLMVVGQDQRVRDVFYGKGARTLERRRIGTRYVFATLRVFVDAANPADLEQARALQDATAVKQRRPGKLDPRNRDGAGPSGESEDDVMTISVAPDVNDGKVVYRLHAPADVPVDAFWSVTVYDAEGRLRKNDLDAYSVNSLTATKTADGSVMIQFGGCNGRVPNCLPTMEGWNYMVRLYRPRPEVLEGKWTFPSATQRPDGSGRGLRG